MESFKIENLSFTYPNREKEAIKNINLTINKGEFVCLCGKSGHGKTTLLRLLKPEISPEGKKEGDIFFEGKPLSDAENKIGFVMQNAESSIVCESVWQELAIGLENRGMDTQLIRTKVAEMASFFGIESWFYKKTNELSGGQKQILTLASVMLENPDVLILDEPTSQLDPISANEFLQMLKRINHEFSKTIIISEHRLSDVVPLCDKIILMDEGEILKSGSTDEVAIFLKESEHDLYRAFPVPMYVYGMSGGDGEFPKSLLKGREWLSKFLKNHPARPLVHDKLVENEVSVEVKDVYFRYEKNESDILKGLNLKVRKGEIFSVLGGNGSGKSTMLYSIAGVNAPYRGSIKIFGENLSQIEERGILGMIPQNPLYLFRRKNIYEDFWEALQKSSLSHEEKEEKIRETALLCRIGGVLKNHPRDLSGGEIQRAALCLLLLNSPQIILLDEPTKGFDSGFKVLFAEILRKLSKDGKTILMVSHDMEFCAEVSHRCAMFFDGNIVSTETVREFFEGNSFYTTEAAKMTKGLLEGTVTRDDIIYSLGGEVKKEIANIPQNFDPPKEVKKKDKPSLLKVLLGSVYLAAFLFISIFDALGELSANTYVVKGLSILMLTFGMFCFFGGRASVPITIMKKRKISKKAMVLSLIMILLVPVTLFIGMRFFQSRKYYFISILIVFETLIAFFAMFEGEKPKPGEIVMISVMCAAAVCGRTAFFALQHFKPVSAIVIIAGVCFGSSGGFLVGSMTGFVSNFFFGQGPWTPWQMVGFGAIGFFAGLFFSRGFLKVNRINLCVFGFLATIVLFGGITNPASVLMWQENPTLEMIILSYGAGLPMDIIHAFSTVFFLWFIGEGIIQKIERIKIKYGLLKN